MSQVFGDDEEQCVMACIRANAYRELMEEGVTFVNRKWVTQKLHRSERWVTDNWKKGYEHCFAKFGDGRPEKLSEESKYIVMENSGKRRRNYKLIVKEIFERTEEAVSRSTIRSGMVLWLFASMEWTWFYAPRSEWWILHLDCSSTQSS